MTMRKPKKLVAWVAACETYGVHRAFEFHDGAKSWVVEFDSECIMDRLPCSPHKIIKLEARGPQRKPTGRKG